MSRFHLVNNNYFISLGKNKFKKVRFAKKIEFEDLDLFWHFNNKKISISEGHTGLSIIEGKKTIKVAEKALENLINEKGVGTIRQQINYQVDQNGLSPRYRFIVEPTRNRNVATKKN